jgi:hypothetical protein
MFPSISSIRVVVGLDTEMDVDSAIQSAAATAAESFYVFDCLRFDPNGRLLLCNETDKRQQWSRCVLEKLIASQVCVEKSTFFSSELSINGNNDIIIIINRFVV